MNHLLQKSLTLLLLVLLTSCSTIYVPTILNTPLLEKKKEATLSANVGITGADFQSSYAISNNLAIMLNYSKFDQNNEEMLKQNFGELAIGYFKKINEQNVAEIFLGFGYGEASSQGDIRFNDQIFEKITGNSEFYRFFLQTDVGLKSEIVETGISIQGSYVHFSKIKYSNSIFNINTSINNYFFTPALFLKIGGPVFKFQAQIAYAWLLNTSNFIFYKPLIFSVGVNLRIGSLD